MYNSIRSIHLELTDKCNAACPQCPRTNPKTGKEFDWIIRTELSLDDIKNMIPTEVLSGLDKIVIGGNYGDPVLAKDFFEIIQYFVENSTCTIFCQTNGSLKSVEWWKQFGKMVAGHNVKTIFALDGVTQEDHEIYRRNTSRDKILQNAKSYIDEGGHAIAQMIVYEHNEWSAEGSKSIYKDMGFKNVSLVATERFYDKEDFTYVHKDQEIKLQRTTIDSGLKKFSWLEGKRDDTQPIACFAKIDQHIYIDCLGYMTPCCFLGMYPYMIKTNPSETNLESYTDEIEEAMNIFRSIDLEEIRYKNVLETVKHPVFNEISEMHKKHLPKKCQRVCGGDKFREIWFKK